MGTGSGQPAGPDNLESSLDPSPEDSSTTPSSDAPPSDPVAVTAMDLGERDFHTRYVEQAPLGTGGMGDVRLCLDSRIGRSVAMKLLRSPQVATSHRARFLREAQIQAQLEHPSVVPVYDMGLSPEGVAFFTMKRVRGRTLSSILLRLRTGEPEARRVYSPRRLLTAFSRACLALDFAHQRGVLHRDLKPANLMLGNFGEVYVLDWGIAAVRTADTWEPEEGESMATLGSAGGDSVAGPGIVGTPGYIAPEVLAGQPFDARSEVYALSAILFEILTLEPLHAGTPEQRIASTRAGGDARASVRAPDREVAPELEELCVRGTASVPAERPAGARELADAVDRYLDGDRDVELRRQRARAHAASARAAAERALEAGGSLADRRVALALVGRAVAFDPNNRIARSVLVRLLATPPDELPAAAERAFGETELADTRRAGRFAAIAYAVLIPVAHGPTLWMGVRVPLLTVLAFGLLAMASGLGVALSRLRRYRRDVPLALFLTSTTGLALAASVFGPFVVTPAVVGINTMAYMFHGRLSPWIAVPYSASLVMIPALLAWLGLIAPAYSFEGNEIHILPRQVDFPEHAAMTLLAVAGAGAVVLGSLYAWYVHRGLASVRHRLHLEAWQLAQTVSDAAEPLTDRRGESPAKSLPTSE